MNNAYESDFFGWAFEQAENLKEKKYTALDIENIAEELESMGRSERSKFESHLKLLIAHLLKWKYQPEKKTNSWKFSILTHRKQAKRTLKENPSLMNKLYERFLDCYEEAKYMACVETGKDEREFPSECPWAFEEIMKDNFLP